MTLDTDMTRRPLGDFEPSNPVPTAGDVARRAFELYEARGREAGADVDDWLQAERELGFVPDEGPTP
jgi:DUF2934 family protein